MNVQENIKLLKKLNILVAPTIILSPSVARGTKLEDHKSKADKYFL